ncbi:immunity 26/phosphotriesterase HocA family protein [Archangium lansingense]|uniref:Immunity 26/phosphotriesterase HocA family protein n=1 Tax=Archangium lansingense TaxID=2995310 RepID=A0ABT3ZXC7_9BACT|nr:immunity 26/phosphotriesterase HocA family protein [Archangium lansinium]MCY1074041.1 immunity 26/phosphotriesterase HocA family protein [Archangium lansinium]
MAKPKHKTGTFVRLMLADGSFGYGRLLEPPHVAFYDYRTTGPDPDLDRIASKPVLFKIAVNLLAVKAWELIGWRALEEHLTQPLVQFRQDVGDFRRCTIFDTAGNTRAASPEECVGLERAAVWEQDSVEERLLDAFLGRPNAAEEHLKVRLR